MKNRTYANTSGKKHHAGKEQQ